MITAKGFTVISMIVVLVVGLGVWRWSDKIFPPAQSGVKSMTAQEMKALTSTPSTPSTPVLPVVGVKANKASATPAAPAAPASPAVTGLLAGDKDVKFVSASSLPKVTGVSDYVKTMKNGKFVVKFPINVWPGWAPIIVANNGLDANDESVFFKKYGFYLELSIVDDPVKARDLYAGGKTHVLWGTLDMFALFAPELVKDSRTSPVIPQQIDFSAGGDGIVARNGIRTINDFATTNPVTGMKRRVVLAQNSTSQYFFMWSILEASVNPAGIDFLWAADAPSAAKLYVQDHTIDAFVGWSPDIYTVADQDKSSRIILSTGRANQAVADVWAVRNDFYNDHPEIVDGLFQGILEGVDMVRKNPAKAAEAIAKAYSIPVADCVNMIGKDGGVAEGDAHLVNYRENHSFFLDGNNAHNFDVIWTRASNIYKAMGYISEVVPSSKVKCTAVTLKFANKYKDVVDMSQRTFTFKDSFAKLESEEMLTKSVCVKFRPGKTDLDPSYDPTITATVEEVGKLVGGFGRAFVLLEGNTDASQKGLVPVDMIRDLSFNRADALKTALITRWKFNPDQIRVVGKGWDNQLPGTMIQDDSEMGKTNRKANRRVDIKVLPLEVQ